MGVKAGVLPASRLDDIATLKDDLLDRHLILTGEFDARLKAIAEAKAAAMPYLDIARTIEEANLIKANAQSAADQSAAAAEAKTSELKEWATAVDAKLAVVNDRNAQLNGQVVAHEAEKSRLQVERAEFAAQLKKERAAHDAALSAERSKLDSERAGVQQLRENVARERAALNASIDLYNESKAGREAALAAAAAEHARKVKDFEANAKAISERNDGLARDLTAKIEQLDIDRARLLDSATASA